MQKQTITSLLTSAAAGDSGAQSANLGWENSHSGPSAGRIAAQSGALVFEPRNRSSTTDAHRWTRMPRTCRQRPVHPRGELEIGSEIRNTVTQLHARTAKILEVVRRRSPSPSGRGKKGEGENVRLSVAFEHPEASSLTTRSPSPRPSPAGRGRIAARARKALPPLWLRHPPRWVHPCPSVVYESWVRFQLRNLG
jgi:hypothetical protein